MTRQTGRGQLNKRQAERGEERRASAAGKRGTRQAATRVRPYDMRSPALESVERRKESLLAESRRRPAQSGGTRRNVRFAAEESLSRPAIALPRKRLPGRRAGLGERLSSIRAQFASSAVESVVSKNADAHWSEPRWGYRPTTPSRAENQDAKSNGPLISEEEQRKLDALEMQLPRVAGKIDSWLLISVLALLCIGVVMVYSASSYIAASQQGDASYYFQRELIWLVLGVVAMLITMRVDYRFWRRISLIGMVIILPLLVIVLKFGITAYGASRWLALGSFFTFQPSELTKLVLALYIADWLARKGNQVSSFLYGLAPFIILVGIVLGLVLLENDLGTAIIIAAFATAMFFTAGANIIQFLLAMACGGLIFLREAFNGYRYYRITGFLHPFQNVTGINLQLYQALLAFGSGGWFGLGLGASRQKTGYLPFPYTDSIFPIIGEELGFIGCTVIVVLFMVLAFRGFRLARRSPDIYGSLLATGITTWLIVQAMINIGANTGTIPYTGVPLPFISFGGSSLVVSLAAIGVLLNISRYIREPEDPVLSRQTLTFRKRRAGKQYVTPA
ncbi:MAG TPA: putative lipid II flippase FtsW [Ktedonobacteraceae bacterium]|nr:putative lipid II flippase FtsW [Ktedonobacteraceae bacterium]